MQCPKCKKEIDDSSAFCKFCGQKTEEKADLADSASADRNEPSRESNGFHEVIEQFREQSLRLLKVCNWIAIAGVAGFILTVLIDLADHSKIYLYSINDGGYLIVLCTIDIVLMLIGAVGIALCLPFSWNKQEIQKKTKILSVIFCLLAVAFSIVLIVSAIQGSRKHSNNYNYSPSYSYWYSNSYGSGSSQADYRVYCQRYMMVTGVTVTHRGNYTYVRGTLMNTGNQKIRFVKVKAVCKNYAGTIVDTDWTYAVDSAWMNPGERKTFEMMISDSGNQIRTANVTVMSD